MFGDHGPWNSLQKEKSIEERSEMDSPTQDSSKTAAVLDSNGTTKRGKDREFPNKKKPSSLKRVSNQFKFN